MKSADKEMNVISENQTVFFNCVGFLKIYIYLPKSIYKLWGSQMTTSIMKSHWKEADMYFWA